MRLSPTTVLITALGWITAVTAHNIQLKAHSRECFHENLHKDDRMSVSFQVGDREFGGSGNLDIDFWVRAGCLLFFSHAAGSDISMLTIVSLFLYLARGPVVSPSILQASGLFGRLYLHCHVRRKIPLLLQQRGMDV